MSARQEQGPNASRQRRRSVARSLPAGLALMAMLATEAFPQTLSSDLLRPERDGFSGQNRPLLRTTRDTGTTDTTAANADSPAPSRIGRIPKYEVPAGSGAAGFGYDSLGRKKKKATKRKPGVSPTVAPREPVAGQPVQIVPVVVPVAPPPPPLPSAATANRPTARAIHDGDCRRPAAAAQAEGGRRSVRRGRLLSRQHADQAGDRTHERL